MNIEIKLDKDFTKFAESLVEKYGEEFEKLNGIHSSNLDFTNFINNFIDKNNKIVDISVNPNANSDTKDITSLLHSMSEPHSKLLAMNKIFYEIKKKYGLKQSKKWLESEWIGESYLHDFTTASFYPYSYKGTETIIVKYRERMFLTTFSQLFELVEEEIVCLNKEDEAYCKYTDDLFVWDIVENENIFTKVSRVIRKKKNDQFRFVRTNNGLTQIVTNNHPMITTRGEISCKDLIENEELVSVKPFVSFGDIQEIYCAEELFKKVNKKLFLKGKEVTDSTDLRDDYSICYSQNRLLIKNKLRLDSNLGYIVGMTLADGSYMRDFISIKQKPGEIFDKIIDICEDLNLPYGCSNYCINIYSKVLYDIFMKLFITKDYCSDKKLQPNILQYNREFISGIISGLIDGDGSCDKSHTRRVSLRLNSRGLLNQISYLLKLFGIQVRDQRYVAYDRGNNFGRPKSGKINHSFNMYFTLYHDTHKFDSIKINKEQILADKNKCERNANSIFSYGFDDCKVIFNEEMIYDSDSFSYDISTETHHFICNNILSHNCYAVDLDQLVEKGLFFINKFKTSPAKHLTTYNDHVLEYIGWLANRQSGAVGLPSYLVYSYWYWQNDIKNNFFLKDSEYYRRQCFQKFIYDCNQPYLRVVQSAFTNITIMDRNYLEELFGGRQFPDGTFVVDMIDGIIEHQKVFMEVIKEVRHQMMATFPVLTYSLLYKDGKFVDEEFAKWCCNHNMEWCDSNFFISGDITSLSSCCRLVNNLNDVNKKKNLGFINSIGGTSLSVGSVKVNTINLRRIALDCKKDKSKYLKLLEDRVDTCVKTLDIVRLIIKRNIEKGLLPNYSFGLLKLENQYNTIGITAMYEAIRDLGMIEEDEFGNKYYTEEGLDFASEILDKISELKEKYDFEYSINIEAIPAENANVKLQKKDSMFYPEEHKENIYSNQWIPLQEKCTIQEKVKLGSILDSKCGGGQISHINVQGDFSNFDQAWQILNYIAKSGVIYSCFNKKISVCINEHGYTGEGSCPTCGEPKYDEFTRIVGFLTPSKSYSKERFEEFNNRKWYQTKEVSNEN